MAMTILITDSTIFDYGFKRQIDLIKDIEPISIDMDIRNPIDTKPKLSKEEFRQIFMDAQEKRKADEIKQAKRREIEERKMVAQHRINLGKSIKNGSKSNLSKFNKKKV